MKIKENESVEYLIGNVIPARDKNRDMITVGILGRANGIEVRRLNLSRPVNSSFLLEHSVQPQGWSHLPGESPIVIPNTVVLNRLFRELAPDWLIMRSEYEAEMKEAQTRARMILESMGFEYPNIRGGCAFRPTPEYISAWTEYKQAFDRVARLPSPPLLEIPNPTSDAIRRLAA